MITKIRVLSIQSKIEAALSEIEKEENVKIQFGSKSFNNKMYKTSLIVTTLEVNEKLDKEDEFLCKRVGFTQNVIGKDFNYNGSEYTLTSIKTRNRKYPVIGENKKTGRSYKFTVESVRKALGGDKLINREANLDSLLKK